MQPDLIRHFPTIYFTFCRGGFAIIHFAMQVYVELAVREDKRREVLGIFNKPSLFCIAPNLP